MKMFTAAAALRDGRVDAARRSSTTRRPGLRDRDGPATPTPWHGPGHLRGRHRLLPQRRGGEVGADARDRTSGRPPRACTACGRRLGIGRNDRGRAVRRGRPAWSSTRRRNRGAGSTWPTGASARASPSRAPAGPRIRGHGQRRPARAAAPGGRRHGQPVEAVPPEQVTRRARLDRAARPDAPCRDQGALVRKGTQIKGYVVGGKTGTAQIWDSRAGSGCTTSSTSPSSATSARDRRRRSSPCASAGQAARRGEGMLQLKITSYELFRRVALDIIDTLGHPATGHTDPCRARRMSGAWTPVAAMAERPEADRERRLVGFGAVELAASRRPTPARGTRQIRGAAVDCRLVGSGQAFFALPGERTDGHRFLVDAARPERPRSS